MDEKDFVRKFYESAANDDFSGCLEALKNISAGTINEQNDDDYDMLIQAVVNGNACAVEALLKDGRCDRTHRENLCGMTAEEFANDYPAGSRISEAFQNAPMSKYIYRNGELIPRDDIYDRIMQGTLEADEGCIMMLQDCQCAMLLVEGKVSKEDFESWLNPNELYWEAQIILLAGDEEYGKKFICWDEVRSEAEPHEWLSFLRDLPQYAHEADWDKLIQEGKTEDWHSLIEVCPELKDKYEEGLMGKYISAPFNLYLACKKNDAEVVRVHLERKKHKPLNENWIYPMPPGFLMELLLSAAVKNNAVECVRLLLEYGADPDIFDRHKENQKTPRELAADKPEILNLFNNRK